MLEMPWDAKSCMNGRGVKLPLISSAPTLSHASSSTASRRSKSTSRAQRSTSPASNGRLEPPWRSRMKSTRFLLALTAANFFLAIALLAQSFGVARAESEASVLRARGLQIVDEQGRVRASISVLPAAPSQDGIVQEETVL